MDFPLPSLNLIKFFISILLQKCYVCANLCIHLLDFLFGQVKARQQALYLIRNEGKVEVLRSIGTVGGTSGIVVLNTLLGVRSVHTITVSTTYKTSKRLVEFFGVMDARLLFLEHRLYLIKQSIVH